MMASNTTNIVCDNYLPILTEGFLQLKDTKEFCDIKLTVGGTTFYCHRVILAACSEYFRSIFTRDFKEKGKDEIALPSEIESEPFNSILNYFYSGILVLCKDTAEAVIKVADYMRLDTLVKACADYLEDDVNDLNCVRHFCIADKLLIQGRNVQSLWDVAVSFIIERVATVSETSDFLDLDAAYISKILKSNNQIGTAGSLFEAVIKWVNHDTVSRKGFLYNLLELLPIDGISYEFVMSKMMNEPLLRQNIQSLQWLLDKVVLRCTTPIVSSQGQPKSFFISGLESSRKCLQLKLADSVPVPISDRPQISFFSAVCHKKRVFLICSKENEASYRLDAPEKSWIDSNINLNFRRRCAGCTVLDDDLFVVGGRHRTEEQPLNSCMKFNFDSCQMVNLPSMIQARVVPGVVGSANSIYAAGGSETPATIEHFDLRQGRWFVIGKFNSAIRGCSSTIVGHFLYSCDVCFGYVERFDLRANRSQDICRLPLTDSGYGYYIASINDEVYAAAPNQIFKYEGSTDNWKRFRSGFNICKPVIVPWI